MFKRSVVSILLLGALVQPAKALDPFTIIKGTEKGLGILGGGGEVGEVAGSVGELYSEIDSTAELNKESAALLREIEETKRLGESLGEESSGLYGVLVDQSDTSASGRVDKITSAIRKGKNVRSIFQTFEKKAQAAEIESNEIGKQGFVSDEQRKLREERMAVAKLKDELKEEKKKRDSIRKLINAPGSRGHKEIGSGVYSFPIDSYVIKKAKTLSETVKPLVKYILVALFLVTILVQMLSFQGSQAMLATLRGVSIALVSFAAIPLIFDFIISVAGEIKFPSIADSNVKMIDIYDADANNLSFLEEVFMYVALFLRTLILWGFELLASAGIGAIIVLAPLLIPLKVITGIGIGFRSMLTVVVFLCLLPLFFNLIGGFIVLMLGAENSAFMASLLSVIAPGIQAFLPVKLMFVFGGPLAGAAAVAGKQVADSVKNIGIGAGSYAAGVTGIGATRKWASSIGVKAGATSRTVVAQAAPLAKNLHSNLKDGKGLSFRKPEKPEKPAWMYQ